MQNKSGRQLFILEDVSIKLQKREQTVSELASNMCCIQTPASGLTLIWWNEQRNSRFQQEAALRRTCLTDLSWMLHRLTVLMFNKLFSSNRLILESETDHVNAVDEMLYIQLMVCPKSLLHQQAPIEVIDFNR